MHFAQNFKIISTTPSVFWLLQKMDICVFIKSYFRTLKNSGNSKVFVIFFPARCKIVQRQFNSLHLARKFAPIIICSSRLTVFLELRVRKTVNFSEHRESADKHLCTLVSRQMRPSFIYQACLQQLPICLCRVASSESFDQQWSCPISFQKEKSPATKLY